MPVICKSRGNLYECVICGVVGGENDNGVDDCDNEEVAGTIDENDHHAMASAGMFDVGSTNISTITPSLEQSDRFGAEEPHYDMYHCQECQTALVEDADMGVDHASTVILVPRN